jgi:hypothetical protein
MTEPMDVEARRLLTAFSGRLNRLDPQPGDWQRFYEFVLYAFRHAPQTAEGLGHALVQDGLGWEEAERFVLFYSHAIELLEREAATTRMPTRPRAGRSVSRAGRKPRARKRRPAARRRKG